MKIVQVDNFNRETVSDILVADGVCERYGKVMVEALIAQFSSGSSEAWFVLAEDDYKLYDHTIIY